MGRWKPAIAAAASAPVDFRNARLFMVPPASHRNILAVSPCNSHRSATPSDQPTGAGSGGRSSGRRGRPPRCGRLPWGSGISVSRQMKSLHAVPVEMPFDHLRPRSSAHVENAIEVVVIRGGTCSEAWRKSVHRLIPCARCHTSTNRSNAAWMSGEAWHRPGPPASCRGVRPGFSLTAFSADGCKLVRRQCPGRPC